MATKILVVAEIADALIKKSTLSAVAFARHTSLPYAMLLLGPGAKAASAEATAFGATDVFTCEDAALVAPLAEVLAPTIAAVAKDKGFDVVVFTASSFGKDIAPRVAAKLGAGYAPDISSVTAEGASLTYKRPVYAGNAYAVCKLVSDIQVVSVRQAEFAPAEASGGQSQVSDVVAAPIDAAAARVQFVDLETAKSDRPDLGEAKVIVSGGRALKEQFSAVLDPLANKLGAAIGASRAACDAGYASPELQVGQTGRVVAPKLYLAIGISGAIQHIAGMKNSKTIVAINKDGDAPIFQIADYGLVADLFNAVPELVSELNK